MEADAPLVPDTKKTKAAVNFDDASIGSMGVSLMATGIYTFSPPHSPHAGFIALLDWNNISTGTRALAIILIALVCLSGTLQIFVPKKWPADPTWQPVLWGFAALCFFISSAINVALTQLLSKGGGNESATA